MTVARAVCTSSEECHGHGSGGSDSWVSSYTCSPIHWYVKLMLLCGISTCHSILVHASILSSSNGLLPIGSLSLISTPGPTVCADRPLGNTYTPSATSDTFQSTFRQTFVSAQPNLNATSCANSSPNPSISPLMNGNIRLMPAPLKRPQTVGGEYSINGELEDDGGEGDGDSSLFPS